MGNRSDWTYDVMNRVTSEKDPTGKIIQYSYDLSGNKSSETRRNGKRFEFGFDALDRLISEKWFTGSTLVNTVTTSYDVRGNILSEQDSASHYTSTYDAQDRLITHDNAGSPGLPHLRLTYTYDSAGKPLTVSDGDVVSESQYDSRSHLSSKRWSGASISPARFDFSYNNRGDRTQVDRFKNLTGTQRIGQSLYDYDAERHLVSLIHRNASLIQTVGHLYQYNSGGEVSSWSRNGSPTTYNYDASGELLSAQPGETFSYDLNGNRTSVTTGTANRALTDGAFDYSYDEEGNLTQKRQLSNGEVTDYLYDHRNRLTSVTRKSSTGTILSTSSYGYDVNNRRIRKTVNGVTTYSLYNDEDTWADYDSGLNITARYLYGERIDEILARHRPTDGLMCYLPDKLGSIQDISDLSGNPVFTSLYKAFGQITQEIGNLLSGDRFRFTGREYDSETGLYYYRARYYDPILGRFISEDPIRFEAGDLNVYRYVGNQATVKVDPSGRSAFTEAVLSIGRQSATGALVGATTTLFLGGNTYQVGVGFMMGGAGAFVGGALQLGLLGDGVLAAGSASAAGAITTQCWLTKKVELVSVMGAALGGAFGAGLDGPFLTRLGMSPDKITKVLSTVIGAFTGEVLGFELSKTATGKDVESDVRWILRQLIEMPNPGLQSALSKICL